MNAARNNYRLVCGGPLAEKRGKPNEIRGGA